jgi:hypothetical protein
MFIWRDLSLYMMALKRLEIYSPWRYDKKVEWCPVMEVDAGSIASRERGLVPMMTIGTPGRR